MREEKNAAPAGAGRWPTWCGCLSCVARQCSLVHPTPSPTPTAQAAPQPADPQELLPEIQRLQRALAFWLPMGPSEDHPLQERIAHDAFLLAGYYGPDEPSAYELGHVALAGTAAPVAQADARAEQSLLKVLTAVQRYLPPDGPSAKDTLSEIIGIVDPWPLGDLKGKA